MWGFACEELFLPKIIHLPSRVFLVTPPFTQLNSPYPATAYLKGFLQKKGFTASQADLGIDVILKLFSRYELTRVFEQPTGIFTPLSENAQHILSMKARYLATINPVIEFLQGKQAALAHAICVRGFLPEAGRFAQLDDLEWAFGKMGIQDKAKHLATLYIDDIADYITEQIDPFFGFSRYAEQLGRSAQTFDELHTALQQPLSFTDHLTLGCLQQYLELEKPNLVALSVPFPGNLLSAFRCGQFIKTNYPHIRIAMGGGFPNTELRALRDARVFDYVDFITLDDGEAPLEVLLQHLEGKVDVSMLKRCFVRLAGEVVYCNGSLQRDYQQHETGTPDYSGLRLRDYISVIEVANPMHRLWSDGVWNKLTMAHGCYWGKCTFCDISLDYIKNYEPLTASLLCDRMEELIASTGLRGFHFVDEAATPALMRSLAIEIRKRGLIVTWWTNIRFEKSFTEDLCYLLKSSGCIAVSGGLEVASDRLLALIDKGITVAQVAQVTRNFTQAGIMVHAYLMYGYPTQSLQETVDSLEMVRQMFAAGILQSAFWHRFAMTVHSPVGQNPSRYQVKINHPELGTFANNDLEFTDPQGHFNDEMGFGLKKSLFNYMHQIGFEKNLQEWFEQKIPKTSIAPDFIQQTLELEPITSAKPTQKVYWFGVAPKVELTTKSKKGHTWSMAHLHFSGWQQNIVLKLPEDQGLWLVSQLNILQGSLGEPITWKDLTESYEAAGIEEDFELFWFNKIRKPLLLQGLLIP